MARKRPTVVSTRVSREDETYVRAEAAREGVPMSDLIWRLVVPPVRERVRTRLAEEDGPEETP